MNKNRLAWFYVGAHLASHRKRPSPERLFLWPFAAHTWPLSAGPSCIRPVSCWSRDSESRTPYPRRPRFRMWRTQSHDDASLTCRTWAQHRPPSTSSKRSATRQKPKRLAWNTYLAILWEVVFDVFVWCFSRQTTNEYFLCSGNHLRNKTND